MKQTLLLLTIIISLNAFAQNKDTVAKKEPNYFLITKVENFNLLLKAVNYPGEITRDEIRYLSELLLKGVQALPAVPIEEKPKTDKPKDDKPKN